MSARSRSSEEDALLQLAANAQSAYFTVTGVWPLVSIGTFQKITGPKVDLWLVKTVGLLVTVVGGVIWSAVRRNRITPEIALLATGSAASLAAIDVVYVARKRISPIYLLDALGEAGLIALWALGWRSSGK